MSRCSLVAVTLLAAAAATGCQSAGPGGALDGGDRDGGSRLTVSAAQSLQRPFEEYAERFAGATVRLSFAGSDALSAQIRQGVRPDVYAAADTVLPRRLFEQGLVERPVQFTGNRLVMAVPAGSEIDALEDLAEEGVDLVVGSEGVPVGAYARQVLAGLSRPVRRAILDNVRSEEPDVSGVVAKLTQGAADAGFLYATDLAAADGRLRAIELPSRLRPRIAYAAAVVVGARRPDAARAFIDGLLSGPGMVALRRAGFVAP